MQRPAVHAARGRSRISLAVIESSMGTRKLLEAALRSEGYDVWTTGSWDDAIQWVKLHGPEVIIADVDRSGLECATLVRLLRSCSKAVLLVIAERSLERESVAALDGGADDYLLKPLSVPELLARVRAKLRRGWDTRPAADDSEKI